MRAQQQLAIRPFEDCHAAAFRDLNLDWIAESFSVEAPDREQLWHPRSKILEPGGQIFVAELGGRPVGTCAVLFVRPGSYELAKMAVSRAARGRGIGRGLLEAAVDWARRNGAREVTLISHSSLVPALRLYEKFGFEHVPIDGFDVEYHRCDIAMRLNLEDEGRPVDTP